jgi:hypothetical protein
MQAFPRSSSALGRTSPSRVQQKCCVHLQQHLQQQFALLLAKRTFNKMEDREFVVWADQLSKGNCEFFNVKIFSGLLC